MPIHKTIPVVGDMPALFNSTTEGSCYTWGEYLGVMQVFPKTHSQVCSLDERGRVVGTNIELNPRKYYNKALFVFHPPSEVAQPTKPQDVATKTFEPILIITAERSPLESWKGLTLGIYRGRDTYVNQGSIGTEISIESLLLETWGKELQLGGECKLVGTMYTFMSLWGSELTPSDSGPNCSPSMVKQNAVEQRSAPNADEGKSDTTIATGTLNPVQIMKTLVEHTSLGRAQWIIGCLVITPIFFVPFGIIVGIILYLMLNRRRFVDAGMYSPFWVLCPLIPIVGIFFGLMLAFNRRSKNAKWPRLA